MPLVAFLLLREKSSCDEEEDSFFACILMDHAAHQPAASDSYQSSSRCFWLLFISAILTKGFWSESGKAEKFPVKMFYLQYLIFMFRWHYVVLRIKQVKDEIKRYWTLLSAFCSDSFSKLPSTYTSSDIFACLCGNIFPLFPYFLLSTLVKDGGKWEGSVSRKHANSLVHFLSLQGLIFPQTPAC